MRYRMRACAVLLLITIHINSHSQVDTLLIYNPNARFGQLDLRIAKSSNEYYYLQEGKTFSFRQKDNVKTNSFLDMTAWDSNPYLQGNMRMVTDSSDDFIMNYRLLVPNSYDEHFADGYPLVLVLHGLQERGNCAGSNCYHGNIDYSPNQNEPPAPVAFDSQLLNNDYNLVHGGSNYLEASTINGYSLPNDPSLPARAFPGFVLFPQNLNGWDALAAEDAIRLLRLVINKYNIDINGIYINGVSNGGHGAYEVMKRAPWLFAAGILFSAADDANITGNNLESIISNIPLWVFQGGVDKHPTPKQTELYIHKLRNAGANVRYTLYPQLGHGTWNKAFSEPDFLSWMLRQKKNNVHVFGGNPVICATTGRGAILSLPEGFSGYEWEHNGAVIDAQGGFQLEALVAGEYRGRFKITIDNKWSEWSAVVTVSVNNPPPIEIQKVGTMYLRDPNFSNETVLTADAGYAHYYWFKNEKQIDFPGTEDDTVRTIKLNPSFGGGAYTLQVADFDDCPTPHSTPVYVYFNDSAPENLPAPTALSLTAESPSKTTLHWKDNSDSEIGFEIWRRKTNGTNDTLWVMTGLTGSDVTQFSDVELVPASSYEYMVRAVSNRGKSPYTDALPFDTPVDATAPSAPMHVTADVTGVTSIKLTWKASSDDSSIKEYVIFNGIDTIRTGSRDSSYLITNAEVNRQYSFYLRSVDMGDNLSEPSNTATIFTSISGLYYQHSTGDWNSLDEIDWTIAEFTGQVSNFTLSPKTQEDFFNFRFDGYLYIIKGGVYQFRISSNDGSRLSLNDSILIVNDGIHNLATVTAPIQILSDGPHRITVDFFDSVLSDTLLVEYKGPDSSNEWVMIPSEKLSGDLVSSAEDPLSGIDLDFTVYPNPATEGKVNLVFTRISAGPVTVSILASTGQYLYHETFNDLTNDGHIQIPDLDAMSTGFYIVEISQLNARKKKKLIIK